MAKKCNAFYQKCSHGQTIKALAKVMGKDVFPDIKLPKPRKERAKETQPRKREEAEFRQEVIKYFKNNGIKYRRIENAIWGKHGNDLPDLWVVYLPTNWAGFVELKSFAGRLDEGQIEFMNDCLACGVKHIVARTIEDLKPIKGET